MTKVPGQTPAASSERAGLQYWNGAENLLDGLYRSWPGGRFPAADLVGIGLDRPHPVHFLVGGLPQRLVLVAAFLRHGKAGGGVVNSTGGAARQRPCSLNNRIGKR